MKIRTDFVTNSSSSSFVTILATEQDGLRKRLELSTDVDGYDAPVDSIDYSTVQSGKDLLETIHEGICYLEDDTNTWLGGILDIRSLRSLVIKQTVDFDGFKQRFSVALVGKEEEPPARKDVEKVFRFVKYTRKMDDVLSGIDFYGFEDSLIRITGCKQPSKEIVIPGYVSNSRVVAIGNKAFAGLTGVVSVTIPDSVLIIGDDAFANCPDLEKVRVPEGIISIGKRAFDGCPKLKKPTVLPEAKDEKAAVKPRKTISGKSAEEGKAELWLSDHAKYIIPGSQIIVKNKSFAFPSLNNLDFDWRLIVEQKLNNLGGSFTHVSEYPDYLICDPCHVKELTKVEDYRHKGWDIKIVLLDDFLKAIEYKPEDTERYRAEKEKKWLSEYADDLTLNPQINVKDNLFVFSGVEVFMKEWPAIKRKLTRMGGIYRTAVSGKTNYLVCNPVYAVDSGVRHVKEQWAKGKKIEIVLLDDFLKAINYTPKK